MNNVFIGANAVVALVTTAFVDMGFNSSNIDTIFEIGASLKSWKPGRLINPITTTSKNKGYYIISKTDQDKSTFFAPNFLNQPVLVYFILGQSNAFGNSLNTNLTAPLNSPIPNSYIYYKPNSTTDNDAAYSLDNGSWKQLSTASNQLTDYLGTFYGPELKFAYEMQAYLNLPIYIIKFAIGDTGLNEESTSGVMGQGGLLDWAPVSTNELYKRAYQDYWLKAKAKLIADGKTPLVKGGLWMQGERDAYTSSTFASSYQANLTALLASFRSDFNSPNMTWAIGRISNEQGIERPYGATIRTAEANVAALTNNVMIDTDSYTMQGDNTHYADHSQLGHDFYLAMRNRL